MDRKQALETAQRARRCVDAATPRMTLAFRCVDVPDRGPELHALEDMIGRARQISFETFARHVDWKPIAREMGYSTARGEKGIDLSKDRAVEFFSSRHQGERVYFMRQSAIEYVFKRQDPGQALKPKDPWR